MTEQHPSRRVAADGRGGPTEAETAVALQAIRPLEIAISDDDVHDLLDTALEAAAGARLRGQAGPFVWGPITHLTVAALALAAIGAGALSRYLPNPHASSGVLVTGVLLFCFLGIAVHEVIEITDRLRRRQALGHDDPHTGAAPRGPR
jgi:hypothetical protein